MPDKQQLVYGFVSFYQLQSENSYYTNKYL